MNGMVLYQAESELAEARVILKEGYGFSPEKLELVPSGRVNLTFRLRLPDGNEAALQRLNPFFGLSPALGDNWQEVYKTLSDCGLACPRLIPAISGEKLVINDSNAWRLVSWLSGTAPKEDGSVRSAGSLLGFCHRALNQPRPVILSALPDNAEFTNQHLCSPDDFELIATYYRRHPGLGSLEKDLTRGRQAAKWLPGRPVYRRVFLARDLVIHGDPKKDNFLFDGSRAIALIDWDTVGYGDPLIDLGEMCRSWAIRTEEPHFQAELAAAAKDGYRESGLEMVTDNGLLSAVIRGLALNLARRYLIDALAEVYFKWDERYPSLYEQNRIRAHNLLDVVEELLDREMELRDL